MNTFIRGARVVLAGAVLAGAGLLGVLPAVTAHAASSQAVSSQAVSFQAETATACSRTADDRWICFLRYCDSYYCYYDCYPTLTARSKGERPSDTVRIPKPEGTPPAQITRP